MEREAKITIPEEESFVFKDQDGIEHVIFMSEINPGRILPRLPYLRLMETDQQTPKLGHTTLFERVLEADLENEQGEGRGSHLTPDELLARDE